MIRTQASDRLNSLPPYIFEELESLKKEYVDKGIDVIDLGVGDPDFPTQENIVNSMKKSLDDPGNHHYPSFRGEQGLREAISDWYREIHGVYLDPAKEVLILAGSKEGIAHMPLAIMNKGDYALVPDPAYPAYHSAVLIAEGVPYPMPLKRENGYLPILENIPGAVARKSKLMYLNYPNNPTSAIANQGFFRKAIDFAINNDLIICHDFAYSELAFDGVKSVSFLSIRDSGECGVEFHTFSKTFAMTGWRLGFVVGRSDIIESLAKIKSCIDSGVFKAVQYAGIEGLRGSRDGIDLMKAEYGRRRDIFAEGLGRLGWDFDIPTATYYFWVKVPGRFKSSMDFSKHLLKTCGVMVTPGIGFGRHGEGYVRIAMNIPIPRIKEAVKRLGMGL